MWLFWQGDPGIPGLGTPGPKGEKVKCVLVCVCTSLHMKVCLYVCMCVCVYRLPTVLSQCFSPLPQGASCGVCQSSPSEVGSGTSFVKVLAGETGPPGPAGPAGEGTDGKQVRPLYLERRGLWGLYLLCQPGLHYFDHACLTWLSQQHTHASVKPTKNTKLTLDHCIHCNLNIGPVMTYAGTPPPTTGYAKVSYKSQLNGKILCLSLITWASVVSAVSTGLYLNG